MKTYGAYGLLICLPALAAAGLNINATWMPFAIEGTLCFIAVCLMIIAYRFATPQYVRMAHTQPIVALVYTALTASITLFCGAQLIRLIGGIFYACTFITDSNAFAYQMQYVLPNFLGGIIASFTAMVGMSFALGCFVMLPLIVVLQRVRRH